MRRVTVTVGGRKKDIICLLQATFKLIGEHKLEILGFAGSLRAGSYDKALLLAAVELLPDGAALEIFNLSGIPPLTRILGAICVQK